DLLQFCILLFNQVLIFLSLCLYCSNLALVIAGRSFQVCHFCFQSILLVFLLFLAVFQFCLLCHQLVLKILYLLNNGFHLFQSFSVIIIHLTVILNLGEHIGNTLRFKKNLCPGICSAVLVQILTSLLHAFVLFITVCLSFF